MDSHEHSESVVQLLREICEQVSLNNRDGDGTNVTLSLLKSLSDYLLNGLDRYPQHVQVCADSISYKAHFPSSRIRRVARLYGTDFGTAASRPTILDRTTGCSWQRRLADQSSSLLRYALRTALNPVPERVPEEASDSDWTVRACDIVEFTLPSLLEGDALFEELPTGNFSKFVSEAASHIVELVGLDPLAWKSRMEGTLSDFCQSTESQRGIASAFVANQVDARKATPGKTPSKLKRNRRRQSVSLRAWTDEEWAIVEEDIRSSTEVLAAIQGAQFLYDVLNLVVQHPRHEQVWRTVIQQRAQVLYNAMTLTSRETFQPEDVHLTLLRFSPSDLLLQLPVLIDSRRRTKCLKELVALSQKFLISGKALDASERRRKRDYKPQITDLECVWQQAWAKCHFPNAILREEDSDDEEEDASTDHR